LNSSLDLNPGRKLLNTIFPEKYIAGKQVQLFALFPYSTLKGEAEL
jgi:hypothetical protein